MSLLRRASPDDSALFYRLRNDPEVRKMSGNYAEIDPDDHHWWWYMVPEQRYVIDVGGYGNGIGYVRVSMDGTTSIALEPNCRGTGLGTEALKEILTVVNHRPLTAVIQYDNIGSQLAFGRAGWRPTQFEVR